jgi:hypothetical protein
MGMQVRTHHDPGLELTLAAMKIASFYQSTHCYLLQATATEEDGQFNSYQISPAT